MFSVVFNHEEDTSNCKNSPPLQEIQVPSRSPDSQVATSLSCRRLYILLDTSTRDRTSRAGQLRVQTRPTWNGQLPETSPCMTTRQPSSDTSQSVRTVSDCPTSSAATWTANTGSRTLPSVRRACAERRWRGRRPSSVLHSSTVVRALTDRAGRNGLVCRRRPQTLGTWRACRAAATEDRRAGALLWDDSDQEWRRIRWLRAPSHLPLLLPVHNNKYYTDIISTGFPLRQTASTVATFQLWIQFVNHQHLRAGLTLSPPTPVNPLKGRDVSWLHLAIQV